MTTPTTQPSSLPRCLTWERSSKDKEQLRRFRPPCLWFCYRSFHAVRAHRWSPMCRHWLRDTRGLCEGQEFKGQVGSRSSHSDSTDRVGLMTGHLQADWVALPLRFMTHVVVTDGMALTQQHSRQTPSQPRCFLSCFFTLTGSLQTFEAQLCYQQTFRFTEKSNLKHHCSILCIRSTLFSRRHV